MMSFGYFGVHVAILLYMNYVNIFFCLFVLIPDCDNNHYVMLCLLYYDFIDEFKLLNGIAKLDYSLLFKLFGNSKGVIINTASDRIEPHRTASDGIGPHQTTSDPGDPNISIVS